MTVSYDVRFGTNFTVNSVNTLVTNSELKSLKQAAVVAKKANNSDESVGYTINKMNHVVKDSVITTVTTGANIFNNNLSYQFDNLNFKIAKPVNFKAENSSFTNFYAGNMNEYDLEGFVEEHNNHTVLLDSSQIGSFYRGWNTDSYGNLDLTLSNTPKSGERMGFLIGVGYFASEVRFGTQQENSNAILRIDSDVPVQARVLGGFNKIYLNQPIILYGAKLELPNEKLEAFSVVSSEGTVVDIIDKDNWNFEDQVIIVNPNYIDSLSKEGSEFKSLWNLASQEEWKIRDSFVRLDYKGSEDEETSAWYLAAAHKITYDPNRATSGNEPIDP